jgi:hypothetical protein
MQTNEKHGIDLPIRPMAIIGLLQVGAIIAGTLGVRAAAKLFASGHTHWQMPMALWFNWWPALMLIPLAWIVLTAWIFSQPTLSDNTKSWSLAGGVVFLLLLICLTIYSVYKIIKAGEWVS